MSPLLKLPRLLECGCRAPRLKWRFRRIPFVCVCRRLWVHNTSPGPACVLQWWDEVTP